MNKNVEALDREFSIYMRVSRANFQGFLVCFTCPAVIHWKEAQNSHFRLRANQLTRFHEDNCRPACRACNMDYNGRPDVFEEELRDEIGDEAVEDIIALSKQIADYDDKWYEDKLKYYRSKNKAFGV